MLEWYDFTVYALFAGYIAANFFPGDDPGTQLVKTFLFFGLGFVVAAPGSGAHRQLRRPRGPQGGAHPDHPADGGRHRHHRLFSHLCDHRHRRAAAAARSVAFCRDFPPAARSAAPRLICSRAPIRKQRGRVASWLEASMGMSNILGALVAFSVTALLSRSRGASLGLADSLPRSDWLIAPVGLYLRRSLDETEAFQVEAERRAASKSRAEGAAAGDISESWTQPVRRLLRGRAVGRRGVCPDDFSAHLCTTSRHLQFQRQAGFRRFAHRQYSLRHRLRRGSAPCRIASAGGAACSSAPRCCCSACCRCSCG